MSEERIKSSCSPRRMIVACRVLRGDPVDWYRQSFFLRPASIKVIRRNLLSPRCDGSSPNRRVKVGDEWFKLVSLDEIPASEIVAFSQRTYGNKWQKRFEEDLVELLTRMGHPPQDTVTSGCSIS